MVPAKNYLAYLVIVPMPEGNKSFITLTPGGSSRTGLFDGDLLDLEPQNDGPDETEGEPGISINDVVCAHVFEVDALLVQEGESLVHVLEAVNAHFALGRARLKEKRYRSVRGL